MAGVVRDGFALLAKDGGTRLEPATITELIKSGESDVLEFKSTARLNLHTREADPRMEHVIVTTVCGFLNHDGGTLLIGVADDGTVLGLEQDMGTLGSKSNVDGYELFLRQLIQNGLTAVTAQTVKIRFERVGTDTVCVVSVAASGRPVFARSAKGAGGEASEFWVRVGNSTRQLHGEEMVDYQRQHW